MNRRNFLYSLPFILNFNTKKGILITLNQNNKEYIFEMDEIRLEEIPLKILNKYSDASFIKVEYSKSKKYLYTRVFWKVPLLEEFNLWIRQKWIEEKNIWNEDEVELIIGGL